MRLPGRRGSTPSGERVPRKDRTGASPVTVGLLTLVVAIVLVYLGFTKGIPFTHDFRMRAVVPSANSVRPNSPVRIAGVNVGKVTGIEREEGSDNAVLVMEIQDRGLPIHKDARLKIRPRIFLEGNFFVDLQPGTPDAPTIDDGDTLPVTQTATPVQFDQILTTLQSDVREDLKIVLDGLGTGLTFAPSIARDADADPDARGESAAQSLNDAIDYGEDAGRGTAIVADALLGTRPDDLSGLIAGLSRVTEGLGRNRAQLQDLVGNFNTTMAAFASRSSELRRSIALLSPTLTSANRALDSLNAAFPDTRAFAREILPGVRETPATIDASFPWIEQMRGLLSPAELQGLARELSPATRDTARLIDATLSLLPQADLVARCATDVVLPTGDVVIQDGRFTTGMPNYREFWVTMVGLAAEGQNFDANGMMVRFQPGAGSQSVNTLGASPGDRLYGTSVAKPLGTRPDYPGRRPPYNPTKPCYTNTPPDLNGAATGPADGSTAPGTAAARAEGTP
jgi:phospholipid/cholesterol/gamma-HCH transport system substrate-binding protein